VAQLLGFEFRTFLIFIYFSLAVFAPQSSDSFAAAQKSNQLKE